MPPGTPPPTLRTTSCSARPIVALARLPWPMQLRPLFMPMRWAIGPLTTSTGPEKYVVHRRPCMLKRSVHAACTAASTTGRYSGKQPAMTALIATFSTVTGTRSGGTTATTSSGARLVPSRMRSTRAGVGGPAGRRPAGPAARERGLDVALDVAGLDAPRGEPAALESHAEPVGVRRVDRQRAAA